MRRRKKLRLLKVKRASLYFLGLVFFLFPGQNYYVTLKLIYRPIKIQKLNLLTSQPVAYPINLASIKPPKVSAEGVVVLDKNSSVLLYGKNENIPLLPASTIKIMTALVALECYHLDEVLTVGKVNNFGQNMRLIEGERITAKNLLYGLLVSSANDAAWVLAQNYSGGEAAFVKAMNQKAKEFHLENTYFANPTGINSDEKGEFLIFLIQALWI